MNKITKIFGAIAVAGVIAAGSSAFTAGGLTRDAPASQFIGGTVTQSVTGATLTDVTYGWSDVAKTVVSTVTLDFSDVDQPLVLTDRIVTITVNADTTFTCVNGDGPNGPVTQSVCSGSEPDVAGIAVTVVEDPDADLI